MDFQQVAIIELTDDLPETHSLISVDPSICADTNFYLFPITVKLLCGHHTVIKIIKSRYHIELLDLHHIGEERHW